MDSFIRSTVLLLAVLCIVGPTSSARVFPINLNTFGSITFENKVLNYDVVYRRIIQPKHVLIFIFSNINMGKTQLKVFTRVGPKVKWEKIITGTVSGRVTITLHSADVGGVIVPKNTGTFKMEYRERHHTACLECKNSKCFVARILSAGITTPPMILGVIYCDWPTVYTSRSCTDYDKEGSVCTFKCGDGYFPQTLGSHEIETKCIATSKNEGSWDEDVENFCLPHEKVLERCFSVSSEPGTETCPYNVDELTEVFNYTEVVLEPITTMNSPQGAQPSIPKHKTRTKKQKKRERKRCKTFCSRSKEGKYKFTCGIFSSFAALRRCKRCRNKGLRCGS